ncbi:MAG: hypothetical protein ACI9S8_001312 [Chlamydiales bacterium]|jgi:hypothetical protein
MSFVVNDHYYLGMSLPTAVMKHVTHVGLNGDRRVMEISNRIAQASLQELKESKERLTELEKGSVQKQISGTYGVCLGLIAVAPHVGLFVHLLGGFIFGGGLFSKTVGDVSYPRAEEMLKKVDAKIRLID